MAYELFTKPLNCLDTLSCTRCACLEANTCIDASVLLNCLRLCGCAVFVRVLCFECQFKGRSSREAQLHGDWPNAKSQQASTIAQVAARNRKSGST